MTVKNIEWEKHREAMQIVGDAIRSGSDSPRLLGDLLTPEQLDLLAVGLDVPGIGPEFGQPHHQPSPLRSNSDAGFGVKR